MEFISAYGLYNLSHICGDMLYTVLVWSIYVVCSLGFITQLCFCVSGTWFHWLTWNQWTQFLRGMLQLPPGKETLVRSLITSWKLHGAPSKTHSHTPTCYHTDPLKPLQTWTPAASDTTGTVTLGSRAAAAGWRGRSYSSRRPLPTVGRPPRFCPPVSSRQVTPDRPRLQGPSPTTPTPHHRTTPQPDPPAMERLGELTQAATND